MGENKTKEKKQNTTHKKALLASSEGVLALAFNGLPMAQQSHSNLRVSGLWVAVCLDKSRSSWFVLPQLLLIPLGSSCDQSDPCFGRLNYLLVDSISHFVVFSSSSLLVWVNPVVPYLSNSSSGLKMGRKSSLSSHYLQGFYTDDSPS